MGSRAYLKTWKEYFLIVMAVILFLLHSPTLIDFRPVEYRTSFSPMKGSLEINDKLTKAEHLFKNRILGPESIVFHKGELYTGTEDGKIVKVTKDTKKLVTVAQIGQDCQLPYEEKLCGRPLGLRMGKDGLLYILDAYYGLHRLNITTGILTRLLPTNTLVEGRRIVFPDDFDIDENGNIYMTDASAKWDLSNIYYLIAEAEGSGRVIRYNSNTGETKVLLKNLHFPNGIQLSLDGTALLICELTKYRLLKYYLKGPKEGQVEVLLNKLPGEPDNIRPSSGGGYWIAFTTARNDTNPILLDVLGPYPTIRRIWGRAQHAIGSVLMAVSHILPYHPFKELAYKVRRGDILLNIIPRHGIIVEIDGNGNIIRSYHSPDGSTSDLSQVTEYDGYLYLGSFVNSYIGRLKL